LSRSLIPFSPSQGFFASLFARSSSKDPPTLRRLSRVSTAPLVLGDAAASASASTAASPSPFGAASACAIATAPALPPAPPPFLGLAAALVDAPAPTHLPTLPLVVVCSPSLQLLPWEMAASQVGVRALTLADAIARLGPPPGHPAPPVSGERVGAAAVACGSPTVGAKAQGDCALAGASTAMQPAPSNAVLGAAKVGTGAGAPASLTLWAEVPPPALQLAVAHATADEPVQLQAAEELRARVALAEAFWALRVDAQVRERLHVPVASFVTIREERRVRSGTCVVWSGLRHLLLSGRGCDVGSLVGHTTAALRGAHALPHTAIALRTTDGLSAGSLPQGTRSLRRGTAGRSARPTDATTVRNHRRAGRYTRAGSAGLCVTAGGPP